MRERTFGMTLGRARAKERRARAEAEALAAVIKEAEEGLRLVSAKSRERCTFSVVERIDGEHVEYFLEGPGPAGGDAEPAGDDDTDVAELPGIG